MPSLVSSSDADPLDDVERSAIAASHLRVLPSEVIASLAVDASRLRVPAGSVLHREGDSSPHLEVVVSGLVRVYVTAPDGRTMTVRYFHDGVLVAGHDPGGHGCRAACTPRFARPAGC